MKILAHHDSNYVVELAETLPLTGGVGKSIKTVEDPTEEKLTKEENVVVADQPSA